MIPPPGDFWQQPSILVVTAGMLSHLLGRRQEAAQHPTIHSTGPNAKLSAKLRNSAAGHWQAEGFEMLGELGPLESLIP